MAFNIISNLLKVKPSSLNNLKVVLSHPAISCRQTGEIHTSAAKCKVEKWHDQNDWVYPPQKPGEPRRPAWVNHCRENIHYSPKKMWYVACLWVNREIPVQMPFCCLHPVKEISDMLEHSPEVRGMSVDEAIKQLAHVPMRGAVIAKEVIQEAQELAVKEHNVEYRSNLWVAESNVGKSIIVKGLRKHARMRIGIIHYRYCHYFVRLVEGPPPKFFYRPILTGNEQLEEYIKELRLRRIHRTL